MFSGQNFEDVLQRFSSTSRLLKMYGFNVLSPLEGVTPRTEVSAREHDTDYKPQMKNHAIVSRDRWYVQNADVVFVDLTGTTRTSVGSVFEIAWAREFGKYIIAVTEPDDVNHRHAFILESVSVVFDNKEDAIQHLTEICVRN